MAGDDGKVQVDAQRRRQVACKGNDAQVLKRREAVERRLGERFKHIPRNVSLVDELITERRGEAERGR